MDQSQQKYVVIGNPIAHSKSPMIHQLFARQTGENILYEALLSPLDEFPQTVEALRKGGGQGANVTVPFKQEAFELADELSEYAQRAGAVNTLAFRDDGTIYGANTDGIGLVRDLVINHQTSLTDKRILILGAGGAVRGVLQPILQQHPKEIYIANRTPERATQLAQDMQDIREGCLLRGGSFAEIDSASETGRFDLIINGTAASLQGIMPPIPDTCLAPGVACYDMMYGGKPTAFENWCEDMGAAKVMNGLGMLVEQAAESFSIWRGVMPDTAPVLEQMRQMWS